MVRPHLFPSYQLLVITQIVFQFYLLLYPLFPLQLKLRKWYEVETYTSVTPWKKIPIDDVINRVR